MPLRYSLTARFFHWLTVALLILIVFFGIWITAYEPKDEELKLRLYNIHESLGVTLFVLIIIRFIYRMVDPPPPLPSDMPRAMQIAAHVNHFALYAVLLVQPVIGFLGTNAWGFPLKWFGLIPIPSPIGKQPNEIAAQFSYAHWIGALLLVTLVSIHIAAVIYHMAIRKDGILKRML